MGVLALKPTLLAVGALALFPRTLDHWARFALVAAAVALIPFLWLGVDPLRQWLTILSDRTSGDLPGGHDYNQGLTAVLGLENPRTWRDTDPTKGWESTSVNGLTRLGTYGADGGKRSAFVRVPDRKAVVIVLTNDDAADAKGMANRILDRLLASGHAGH